MSHNYSRRRCCIRAEEIGEEKGQVERGESVPWGCEWAGWRLGAGWKGEIGRAVALWTLVLKTGE